MKGQPGRYRTWCFVGLIVLLSLVAYYMSAGPTLADPAPTTASSTAAGTTTAAAPKATFVGTDTCVDCHDDVATELAANTHGQMMSALEAKEQGHLCEGCHGPGSVHADDPSPETAKPLLDTAKNGTGCLTCHNARLSSLKWQGSDHHRAGVNCLACHGQVAPAAESDTTAATPATTARQSPDQVIDPHAALTYNPATETCLACHGAQRAEFAMASHHPVIEGRVTCADCHDPHAPMDDHIKKDTCVKCHAEQGSLHRFEHGAISSDLGDACLECHRPHGSPNPSMLKVTGRALCLQCHGNKVSHHEGLACYDCHTAVHGSNSARSLLSP